MPKLNSTRNTRRKYVPEKDAKEVENKNMSFYNSKAWRVTSSMYRKDNPLCESCANKGITAAAAHTDHTISIEQGGHKYDINNLMSLCISCHSTKTQAEKEGILVEYKGTFSQFVPVDKSSIFEKVTGETLKKAIKLCDYFEKTMLSMVDRVGAKVEETTILDLPEKTRLIYESLPNEFSFSEGEIIARKVQASRRTYTRLLKREDLVNKNERTGIYNKLILIKHGTNDTMTPNDYKVMICNNL